MWAVLLSSSMRRSTKWICSSAYILIAFSDTISLSAHILIASADSLIVMEHTIKESEEEVYLLLPISYFCVVTSSRCHTLSITNWERLYYPRDNGVTTTFYCHLVVTRLSVCLSTLFTLRDNVTTKNKFFLGGESDGYSRWSCNRTIHTMIDWRCE